MTHVITPYIIAEAPGTDSRLAPLFSTLAFIQSIHAGVGGMAQRYSLNTTAPAPLGPIAMLPHGPQEAPLSPHSAVAHEASRRLQSYAYSPHSLIARELHYVASKTSVWMCVFPGVVLMQAEDLVQELAHQRQNNPQIGPQATTLRCAFCTLRLNQPATGHDTLRTLGQIQHAYAHLRHRRAAALEGARQTGFTLADTTPQMLANAIT